MATIQIPTPLRGFTSQQKEIRTTGATVGQSLQELARVFPGVGARLLDGRGEVLRYVNIFRNDEDIRFLEGLATPVSEGDRITIISAIAGG